MSIIHLAVGDLAANAIEQAIEQDEQINGAVIVLKDVLSVGSLKDERIGAFSEVRSQFWNMVMGDGQTPVSVDDLERLMQLSSRMSNDESLKVWFWMGPIPADVTAYFWLLHFLKKHQGRLHVVNISGLPFLDEQGKLFYPESIAQLPKKEILKARKLSRVVAPSEWETDGDEWKRLASENAGVRILEGGKKLTGKPIDFYDEYLLALLTAQVQKANKIVNQAMTKNKILTGDLFLHWRLRCIAATGKIELQKGEVKLSGGADTPVEAAAPIDDNAN
jgi:hypothetical protein